MKDSEYNSVVVFERGITFKDDKGNLWGLDNDLDYKEDVSYVKSYDDYIKENYPTEIAKNYDNSQICYDNRMEDDDLEEEE